MATQSQPPTERAPRFWDFRRKPTNSPENSPGSVGPPNVFSPGVPDGNPVGPTVGPAVGPTDGNPTGKPDGTTSGHTTGSANGTPQGAADSDHVFFCRVGDSYEPVSVRRPTPLDRAVELVQHLQRRGLADGWFAVSDLEGIYHRFVRDAGLQPIPWLSVLCELGKITRKRKKESTDADGERRTKTQYYIPAPAKKRRRPQQ